MIAHQYAHAIDARRLRDLPVYRLDAIQSCKSHVNLNIANLSVKVCLATQGSVYAILIASWVWCEMTYSVEVPL